MPNLDVMVYVWFASLMLHSALPLCHPPNLAASREEFPQLRNALGFVLPAPMEPGKSVSGPRQRRRIICECPAGCQRQVEDSMLHAWLCWSCSGGN